MEGGNPRCLGDKDRSIVHRLREPYDLIAGIRENIIGSPCFL